MSRGIARSSASKGRPGSHCIILLNVFQTEHRLGRCRRRQHYVCPLHFLTKLERLTAFAPDSLATLAARFTVDSQRRR